MGFFAFSCITLAANHLSIYNSCWACQLEMIVANLPMLVARSRAL